MNLLINKEQQENIVNMVQKILNREIVSDSYLVCGIKVYPAIDEEELKNGSIFFLNVYLSLDMLKLYNQDGVNGLKKGSKKKIEEVIHKWFSFDDSKYFINFLGGEC